MLVCSAQDVDNAVQKYFDLGVRHVFPIHFADNLFGGTAFQNGLQGDGVDITITIPTYKTVSTPYVLQTQEGTSHGYEYRGGRQNTRGMTALGTTLIQSLMSRGMLFDIDHMSYATRSAVLDLAETTNYPVISGHSGYIDVCRGDKRHEGQLTSAEVERICRLGGWSRPSSPKERSIRSRRGIVPMELRSRMSAASRSILSLRRTSTRWKRCKEVESRLARTSTVSRGSRAPWADRKPVLGERPQVPIS